MSKLRVGSTVKIKTKPAFGLGTVKWIGKTASGTTIGVSFTKPVADSDGSLDGKRYFQCKPKHGYFAKPSEIARVMRKERSPSPAARGKKAPPKRSPKRAPTKGPTPKGLSPASAGPRKVRRVKKTVKKVAKSPAPRKGPAKVKRVVKRVVKGKRVKKSPKKVTVAKKKVSAKKRPPGTTKPKQKPKEPEVPEEDPELVSLRLETKELKSQVEELKEKSVQLEEKKKLEELLTQQIIQIKANLQESEKNAESLKQEYDEFKSSMDTATIIAPFEEKIKQLEEKHKHELQFATEELDMAVLDKEIAEEQLQQNNEEMVKMVDEIKLLHQFRQTVLDRDKERQEKVASGEGDVPLSDKDMDVVLNQNQLLRSALYTLKHQAEERISALQNETGDIPKMREKMTALEVALYNKEQEIGTLQSQVDNSKHLEDQLEGLVQSKLALEERTEILKERISDLTELNKLSEEMEMEQAEVEGALLNQIQARDSEVSQLRAVNASLTRKINEFEDTISQYQVLVEMEDVHVSSGKTTANGSNTEDKLEKLANVNYELQKKIRKAVVDEIDNEIESMRLDEVATKLDLYTTVVPDELLVGDMEVYEFYFGFQRMIRKTAIVLRFVNRQMEFDKVIEDDYDEHKHFLIKLHVRLSNIQQELEITSRIIKGDSGAVAVEIAQKEGSEIEQNEKRIDKLLDLIKADDLSQSYQLDELDSVQSFLSKILDESLVGGTGYPSSRFYHRPFNTVKDYLFLFILACKEKEEETVVGIAQLKGLAKTVQGFCKKVSSLALRKDPVWLRNLDNMVAVVSSLMKQFTGAESTKKRIVDFLATFDEDKLRLDIQTANNVLNEENVDSTAIPPIAPPAKGEGLGVRDSFGVWMDWLSEVMDEFAQTLDNDVLSVALPPNPPDALQARALKIRGRIERTSVMERMVNSSREQLDGKLKIISSYKTKLTGAMRDLSKKSTEMEKNEKKYQQLSSKYEKLNNEYGALKNQHDDAVSRLKANLVRTQETTDELAGKLRIQEVRNEDVTVNSQEMTRYQALEAKLQESRKKITALQSSIKFMQNRLDLAQKQVYTSSSSNKLLKPLNVPRNDTPTLEQISSSQKRLSEIDGMIHKTQLSLLPSVIDLTKKTPAPVQYQDGTLKLLDCCDKSSSYFNYLRLNLVKDVPYTTIRDRIASKIPSQN